MKTNRVLALVPFVIVLHGCGGGGSAEVEPPPVAPSTPNLSALEPADACQALVGYQIQRSLIGLPTSGAEVTAAVLVRSTDAGNTAGEYCRVDGAVKSVDTSAQNINFRINIPTNWNRKALQFGGGGYDGRIAESTGRAPLGLYNGPVPLAQGYMTLGSDSGHQHPDSNDASFGMNDEQLINFAHMHIKKVRDVANELAKYRFGVETRRFYFAGALLHKASPLSW